MKFNKYLDVQTLKTEHECEEHWQLRRMFLLKHKRKFPEDRLICHAQCFINIETLGCRYPDETMKLISSLSEGIIENFREKRKSKLQRTFVQASDAAESKAKGWKRSHDGQSTTVGSETPVSKYIKPISFQRASVTVDEVSPTSSGGLMRPKGGLPSQPTTESERPSVLSRTTGFKHVVEVCSTTVSVNASESSMVKIKPSAAHKVKQPEDRSGGSERTSESLHIEMPPNNCDRNAQLNMLKNVILVENKFHTCNAIDILQRSLQLSGFPVDNMFNYTTLPNGNITCSLLVNGQVCGTAEAISKILARGTVVQNVLDNMREYCYTIEVKANYVSEKAVDKSFQGANKSRGGAGVALSDDNQGNKLLRMMGWSGGGLGKNGQGIETPITVTESVNRSGLGLHNLTIHQSRNKIQELLKRFKSKDTGLDLAFSPDFTKDERAAIHVLAERFNLKTKSHGSGDQRHLVVSKKERPDDILHRLIQSGGSTEKYNLIKPKLMV